MSTSGGAAAGWRLSVTARIALLSIGLALVSTLSLVGFVWRQSHDAAIDAVRRDTIEQADALAAVYRSGGLPALTGAIADARAPGDASLVVALVDAGGQRIAGYGPARLVVPLAPESFRIAALGDAPPWRGREAGYALRPVGGRWLLSGRTLDVLAAEQRGIERALAVSLLLALALGVGGGLVVARYVGRRLDAIADVVERVGEGDLSRRVALVADAGRGGDAFDRLAVRLNATLTRLEGLMGELRVVTDSLAHDLRSPLARLRTRTEQALLTADATQRDAALGGLLGETDLVMRMLSMVIEISRSESVTRDRFVPIAPAVLIEEIGELYEPVAEDAGLRFTVAIDDRPQPLPLHRELMSQAITNMLDNAIRHGAGGASLVLRLAMQGREVLIQVEDRGPGIAAEDRAQAMKRFGRLDQARSTPGAGLGLSLIEAVARLHGGRFELGDNAPGLVARIVLPNGD